LLFLTVTPEIDEVEEAKPVDQAVQSQKVKKSKPIDA
jgi:hypothetical protein